MEQFLELLNWVDYFILLGITGCALVGFGIGFYRIAGIGGSLTLGFFVAAAFSTDLARAEIFDPIRERVGPASAETASYALILLASFVGGLAVLLLFRTFFSRTLKLFDGIVGGALAIAVGAFVIGTVVLGLGRLEDHPLQNDVLQAYFGPPVAASARLASRLFPKDFGDQIQSSFEVADRATRNAIID